ncbi:MAG: PAS domain S-box protein, partial [Candidatus Electrothrix sp. AUS4]|nr:PAS domain S-box protein [Candidatus Electrothrix sp. AUS4]
MNFEHAYATIHAVLHPFLWGWGGALLLLFFLLLSARSRKKDLHQLQVLNTELNKDLQQQRAALSEAKKVTALFQQTVDALPDGILITRPSGHIQYSNSTAQEISGYTGEQLLGQPFVIILPEITEERTKEVTEEWRIVQAKRKDNSEYSARVLKKDINSLQGEFLGFPFVLQDLSARQRKEQEQVREHQKLTERLQKSRRLESIGMMAGGVAHDLNNILAGVLHYPEQISRSLPEDSDLRPSLSALNRSTRQAVALVTDLLSAAKAVSAVKEIIDLNKLTDNILQSKEVLCIFAERPELTLHARLSSESLPISCSPPHIHQCLHNLLRNASDTILSSREGVGTVTVSVDSRYLASPSCSKFSSGEYAILSVADTSPSFSAADRAHIFEPFYSQKNIKGRGAGIALAVLRNIVEEHDGCVDLVDQEDGRGNRFDLYFPLRKICIGTKDENSNQKRQGQCLLIVEQDKSQREAMSDFLTEQGYQALSVADDTGALSYLNRNTVDLVILNLNDNEPEEVQSLYEQIRFLHPSQKALLVCASPEKASVKKMQECGEVCLLLTPFKQEQL